MVKNIPLALDMVDFISEYLHKTVDSVGGTERDLINLLHDEHTSKPIEPEPGLTDVVDPRRNEDGIDLTGYSIFAYRVPGKGVVSGQDIFREFIKRFESENNKTLTQRQKRTMLGFMHNNIGFINKMALDKCLKENPNSGLIQHKLLGEGSYEYFKHLSTITNEDLVKAKSLLHDLFDVEAYNTSTGEVLDKTSLPKYVSDLVGHDKMELKYHTKAGNSKDLTVVRNLMMANGT